MIPALQQGCELNTDHLNHRVVRWLAGAGAGPTGCGKKGGGGDGPFKILQVTAASDACMLQATAETQDAYKHRHAGRVIKRCKKMAGPLAGRTQRL
jgi:hypothetical protein